MTPTAYYEKRIFARNMGHDARFAAYTEHLPAREELTPYHSEAHSLRSMEIAYTLACAPRFVLETGFCLGHSASIWFGIGAHSVTSIECSQRKQTMDAGRIMKERHGGRFRLLITTSEHLMDWVADPPFDLMFIDGGHDFQDVSNDIKLGLHLKIPFLLFDDWFPKWGPGVQPAIEHHNLIPIAILGNMALCVPPDGWKD